MGTEFLEEMIILSKAIGTIKKINMYSENTIYIVGETADGNTFNFDLRIEEEKENA